MYMVIRDENIENIKIATKNIKWVIENYELGDDLKLELILLAIKRIDEILA